VRDISFQACHGGLRVGIIVLLQDSRGQGTGDREQQSSESREQLNRVWRFRLQIAKYELQNVVAFMRFEICNEHFAICNLCFLNPEP
jgi:hypothetical protein